MLDNDKITVLSHLFLFRFLYRFVEVISDEIAMACEGKISVQNQNVTIPSVGRIEEMEVEE